MKKISDQTFSKERSLYNLNDAEVVNCKFLPLDEDGESPLKESTNIVVDKCLFELRYAMWHVDGITIKNTTLTEKCRAPLWYSKNINISHSDLLGVKILREAMDITINNCKIISSEFCWKNEKIHIKNTTIDGDYSFLLCKNIELEHITFTGKYAFQYMENVKISNSNINTKDAFWHGKNLVITDSILIGQYIGWYSENLTLINCEIESIQPFCYCKNLKLVNCKMPKCDLAFEYSEVEADIIGSIISIKNPKSGIITVDEVGEIINDEQKYPCNGKILIRSK